MKPKLPADHTFGIAFDTDKFKSQNMLSVVSVTLKEDVMALDEVVFINLCEHPLYPKLVQYVKSNPARK